MFKSLRKTTEHSKEGTGIAAAQLLTRFRSAAGARTVASTGNTRRDQFLRITVDGQTYLRGLGHDTCSLGKPGNFFFRALFLTHSSDLGHCRHHPQCRPPATTDDLGSAPNAVAPVGVRSIFCVSFALALSRARALNYDDSPTKLGSVPRRCGSTRSTTGLFNLAALAALVQGVQHFHIHFATAARTRCTSAFALQKCLPSAARILAWLALSEVEV